MFFIYVGLKEEYSNYESCKCAVERYNEGKPPEEQLAFCSYFNVLTKKRMYVPCTVEYFHLWRNMLREERRKKDIESRCLVPSIRYNYYKKCMENCRYCPYGKYVRDGRVLSLDALYDDYMYEIADEFQASPEEMVMEDERIKALRREFNTLDGESQMILMLFAYNFTDEHIGKVLGLKRSTVQYKKSQLVKDLRKKLENY